MEELQHEHEYVQGALAKFTEMRELGDRFTSQNSIDSLMRDQKQDERSVLALFKI